MVQEPQLFLLRLQGQGFQVLEEVVMVVLVREAEVGEVPWVCRQTAQTLGKPVGLAKGVITHRRDLQVLKVAAVSALQLVKTY